MLNTNTWKSHEKGLKEGLKQGREQGLKEGIEQGRIDTTKENARRFKKLRIATDVISQATGLSREEIEAL